MGTGPAGVLHGLLEARGNSEPPHRALLAEEEGAARLSAWLSAPGQVLGRSERVRSVLGWAREREMPGELLRTGRVGAAGAGAAEMRLRSAASAPTCSSAPALASLRVQRPRERSLSLRVEWFGAEG